ncbi:MAG: N-acetyltransferase [Rhodospirillales bacterium]|nr:N-acetyltransferase [Rhodospirillales bacterium]
MPDAGPTHTVEILDSIGDVAASAWDTCAGSANPFVGHAFLTALEDSGSACTQSGWRPRHLVLFDGGRRLLGCMPLYLKGHSWGEYVFDWAWAEAFERAGGCYYPKLQAAVPFTPVTGPRLLLHPQAPAAAFSALAVASVDLAMRLGVSSLHVTFPSEDQALRLQEHGFFIREGHQYHWHNRGYGSFDDFLADLSSRKRKAIRKERAAIASSGYILRTLCGGEIEARHWAAFWRFYLDTVERKYAHAYLERDFFDRLGATMGERVVLIVAETPAGETVAGALNLLGEDALYGRYWGSSEACRFLHFEACYYRAIDFAIARGLARVEAGAQGEHKVQRGYLPQRTWSAHWIAHPGLRRAVGQFLEAERPAVEAAIAALNEEAPFRSDLATRFAPR